ncbi:MULTISPECIES: hypothetical protein [Haloarcula]|uniref:Uncharacterized protein n=2 Tax=Haloarcula sebkhae TaxID=932660 RepID=A0ACC6VR80_9EURY|nr:MULTISPECIES: hypothetical protein [Haloarcula]GGK79965.1 hypothetical protein GCM10009067_35350 [Haloarcula sebkhae]
MVRVVDEGYEVVNGHKRLWVAYVTDLESIRTHVVHLGECEAIKRFVPNHFDGSSSQPGADVATARLRERWEGRIADLNIPSEHLQTTQGQEEQASI